MTDDALRRLSPRFDAIYATTSRPSIPPEHLLRALLLQVLYSVRSERMLMEQLGELASFCSPRPLQPGPHADARGDDVMRGRPSHRDARDTQLPPILESTTGVVMNA
jgi:hypothetical protein